MRCSLIGYCLVLAASASLVTACSSDSSRRGSVTLETALVQYNSCSALEADLKELFVDEMEAQIEQNGYWGSPVLDGVPGVPTEDAADGGGNGGGRQEGVDFSGTNNQEDGVDEADFVKTDGYNVYTLNGNRLHVFGVPEVGQLVASAEFPIEGHPSQMLLHREAGKVIVFSHVSPYNLPEDHPLRARIGTQEGDAWMWRTGEVSKVTIVDVANPAEPAMERELFMEASYQTARMIDSSVRIGAYSWMNIPGLYDLWDHHDGTDASTERVKREARSRIRGLSLSDIIPQIYERLPDGSLTTHSLSQDSCRSFYRPENSHGRGFTSIMSLDLSDSEVFRYDADHIVSNYPTVYASKDFLYVAEQANAGWWFWWNEDHPEQINLHMFDIRQAGETAYLGSGRVEGALLNQFSLDEHDGYLRVAATTDRWARWWVEEPPASDNHIYVLTLRDRKLTQIGHLSGLGKGEQIFAARMVGDRGYLVTFRQIDPLFTLDLSDPRDPRVIGELKIPGFSTYIHPIADDKLLTIGVGGDDDGANWLTQISMFDVGDFASPALQDRQELVSEGEWGWSEALYEHKAFQYFAPKNLLAVPLSGSNHDETGWHYRSTLQLVSVDNESGLSSHGVIDHTHLFETGDPERFWYYTDVRRSIFMGDFIYAISDRGITVHHLDDIDTVVAQEEMPGYTPDDFWWWW